MTNSNNRPKTLAYKCVMLLWTPFNRSNPTLARDHLASFEKCKGFQEKNIKQLDEFKNMFAFIFSAYARSLYNKMKVTSNTMRELKDVFL